MKYHTENFKNSGLLFLFKFVCLMILNLIFLFKR